LTTLSEPKAHQSLPASCLARPSTCSHTPHRPSPRSSSNEDLSLNGCTRPIERPTHYLDDHVCREQGERRCPQRYCGRGCAACGAARGRGLQGEFPSSLDLAGDGMRVELGR
jgi:hypothetical protein